MVRNTGSMDLKGQTKAIIILTAAQKTQVGEQAFPRVIFTHAIAAQYIRNNPKDPN